MRLTRLMVKGFRAFGRATDIDLAADVVVLVGPNGSGKTSVFDAVEWGLFGVIPRLRGNRDAVGEDYTRNRFLPSDRPEVALYLANSEGTAVVRRSGQELVVVDETGTELQNEAANTWVSNQVTGGKTVRAAASVDVFQRTSLLGQDRIVDFVRDTNPRERFDSLSNLLGADFVRRFHQYVDRASQTATSRKQAAEVALLQAERQLEDLRVRRLRLENDAALSPPATADRVEAELSKLSRSSVELGLTWPVETSNSGLEATLMRLQDLEIQAESYDQRAAETLNLIASLQEQSQQIQATQAQLPSLTEQAEAARSSERVAAERRQEAEKALQALLLEEQELQASLEQIRRDRRDFVEFLSLAHQHVTGANCPVCEQSIDRAAVLRRLEERTSELVPMEASLVRQSADLSARATALRLSVQNAKAELDRLRLSARQNQVALRSASKQVDDWNTQRRELLQAEGVADLEAARELARARRSRLAALMAQVEDLTRQGLAAQAKSELETMKPLESKARAARDAATIERDSLQRVAELLDKVSGDAKESEIQIVEAAINRQLPTLQAVYRRLNPHPIFDTLTVTFRALNERGEVYYRAVQGNVSGNASMLFSSAQMNAVAVSVFLALNLLRPSRGLGLILLDDPIQNMDDYNVLGLVDLLRALRGTRQLIVSTHDEQLGELFLRKLRPVDPAQRTLVHRFESGDEQGPRLLSTSSDYAPAAYVLRDMAV